MQDGSTISIHASFSASGSNIILDLFQSAITHSVPFSDVYYKWQFLGIFREGIVCVHRERFDDEELVQGRHVENQAPRAIRLRTQENDVV